MVTSSRGDKMIYRRTINELSSLVDHARQLAIELNETTAAYILSIASLEISERIEQRGRPLGSGVKKLRAKYEIRRNTKAH
jgi:hypothetical protein